MKKTITIVGTGLIGGSLAKALKSSGFAKEIIGVDRNRQELKRAQELGVIDLACGNLADAVNTTDIVVLAVPVLSMESVLCELTEYLDDGTVVTDVGSSKANVVAAAKKSLGKSAATFVPGHPIAGREKSGVSSADGELFQGHRVILTPDEHTDPTAVEAVTAMWQATGAEVQQLGVDQHDLVLAATSHLPHVLAYATVDTLAATDYVDQIFEFAAGGFRDFTRIASSDPVMWRDICLANRSGILNVLSQFESHLATVRRYIESGDETNLTKLFRNAKEIRDDFFLSSQQRQRD